MQEQEFERVGSSQTVKVNVRIITATNRDLQTLVEQGEFRADLFYRINVFPLWVPALRQRTSDIPLLAHYFLTNIQRHIGRQSSGLTPQSLDKMMKYSWPGNVRELYNIIERSLILHRGTGLLSVQIEVEAGFADSINDVENNDQRQISTPLICSLAEAEKRHILLALSSCKDKISGKKGAAEVLQLPVSTLRSRMKKLGIRK